MVRQIPTYYLGEDFTERLDAFVDSFLAEGYDFFSEEFKQIDSYIAEAASKPVSESLRLTPKPKYLLELVAFKIYDKLNREAFNRSRHTLIVMPDCLTLHNPDCRKIDTQYGDVCRRCTENCQAFQIGELAREYHAKIIFSKRKLGKQLRRYSDRLGDLGVIGIACTMMLASGMRTAAEEKIPTRGVLLNFSGCEHWNDEPCASEFTLSSLESILREKHEYHNKKTDA
ncbi:MAG: DUF116 domain-containing protein [candidate division Zixibacteria bacterium]|nr:DUF116 domain-containing protein [candidate division Zixibacteria bacterium]